MLQTLIAWLNGTREYNMGVAIYRIIGEDYKLKILFEKGYNLYNNFRLQEELKRICDEEKKKLQKQVELHVGVIKVTDKILSSFKNKNNGKPPVKLPAMGGYGETEKIEENKAESIPNTALYEAARNEALIVYKETMNKRALLFNMVPSDYTEPNKGDLVLARQPLALEVLRGSIEYSKLFDKADYVKKHGKLPEAYDSEDDGIAELQDHEVKQALDNARKAFNKLKGREQTAERVALMQKHQDKILKLEERWRCLKQPK
jgi:hypothetical protein